MKVTREEPDFHVERLLATGLIISDEFLRKVTQFDKKYIESRYVRLVADWAWTYWQKYHKPVGNHIGDLYQAQLRSGALQEDLSENIADFLESISGEYERADHFNVDYAVEQTERLLRIRKAKQVGEDTLAFLSQDRLEEAEDAIQQYRQAPKLDVSAIQPFKNLDAIFDAFERQTVPLFTFPGALGQMLNEQLTREGFIGILAPEKRGKTWWQMEFCFAALKARCNVALFEVGDMSQAQMLRRMFIRLTGKSDRIQYCGTIRVPVLDCALNQTDECKLPQRVSTCGIREGETLLEFGQQPKAYRPCSVCSKREEHPNPYQGAVWYEERRIPSPVNWREAASAARKWAARTRGRDFKLVTVPSDTLTVKGIERYLDGWEMNEGFIPDVIVIDYADILAPENRSVEARQQENERWKALRSLSQKRKCLVITATQADADSYDSFLLKMKNFSEDKRKYGHVTGMIGLNQTEDEKRNGLMRLSWIVLREGMFDITRTVTVLQSLAIGRPHLASYWG